MVAATRPASGQEKLLSPDSKGFFKANKRFWKKVKKTNHAKHLNLMYPVKV